jgi:hypothetical protein
MSGFSPKKMAEALVEKHDRFISGYSDELDKMRQMTMLKEKKDQLRHWVAENGGKAKYSKELEDTENELSQLQTAFKPKTQSYYAGLREKVDEHKKAREYWLGRSGELKT